MANSNVTRTWHVEAEAAKDMPLTLAGRAAAHGKGQTAARALPRSYRSFSASKVRAGGCSVVIVADIVLMLPCCPIAGAGSIVMLGAGLVGSMYALMLARKGLSVTLFEWCGGIRSMPSAGRSINLSQGCN